MRKCQPYRNEWNSLNSGPLLTIPAVHDTEVKRYVRRHHSSSFETPHHSWCHQHQSCKLEGCKTHVSAYFFVFLPRHRLIGFNSFVVRLDEDFSGAPFPGFPLRVQEPFFLIRCITSTGWACMDPAAGCGGAAGSSPSLSSPPSTGS